MDDEFKKSSVVSVLTRVTMLLSLLVQSLELDHLLLLQEELNLTVSELKVTPLIII